MNREAFKLRMQALKSYRESNPDKGYWDWKVLSYEDGGEIPPTRPEPIERIPYKGKLYTDKLGNKYTEQLYLDYLANSTDEISKFDLLPMVRGLDPVVDIEDMLGFTPIGDAMAIKDTYDAVSNKDWLGAGLAALTVLPFVPNSVSKLKRVTPAINRQGGDLIERIMRAREKEIKMSTRLNNETYDAAERLLEDPSYIRRAELVKNKYGDDYLTTYADIINTYNESPDLLPKAKGTNTLGEARGKMLTTSKATKRHMEGGDFPGIGEYEYLFNIDRGVPYGATIHEINHYTDFLKNKAPDAVGDSNMYKWMRSAIKPYSDGASKYFAKPTEQKAYMNLLREFMYTNGMINTRDLIVTPTLLKEAIDKLPKGMDSIKKASDLFKSMKSYTKWFNAIPLLGVGAIGANKYFNDNER